VGAWVQIGFTAGGRAPILNWVSLRIRPATAADAGRVTELAGHLGYAVTEEAVRGRLVLLRGDDHALSVAATPKEGIVGWVEVRLEQTILTERRCRVTGLVVSPDARRSGVGRALLLWAESWARAHGCHEAYLTTNVRREDAHAFYDAAGWERRKTSHVYVRRVGPGGVAGG
jgi:GNAT superfamily N-acetyltransferase